MVNVLFSRTNDPNTKPITDGQLIFDTSGNGKMYLDNGSTRLEMGGASKLAWKMIGSTHTIGTGSVTIPTSASELIIKANIGYNIIIDIPIPVAFLMATEQSYRGGYFQNGSNGGMADFKCTKSKVTFNSAFLNGSAVTTTTEWVVYYR